MKASQLLDEVLIQEVQDLKRRLGIGEAADLGEEEVSREQRYYTGANPKGQVCSRCHGSGMVRMTLKDKGGRNTHGFGNEHIVVCPQCDGKGHVTKEDHDRYYRSVYGRDESLIQEVRTEAMLAKHIKKVLQPVVGVPIRVNTGMSKRPYISAWIQATRNPDVRAPLQYPGVFPAKVRSAALNVIYGPSFAHNTDDPNAGNVRSNSIAMSSNQWMKLLDVLGLPPFTPPPAPAPDAPAEPTGQTVDADFDTGVPPPASAADFGEALTASDLIDEMVPNKLTFGIGEGVQTTTLQNFWDGSSPAADVNIGGAMGQRLSRPVLVGKVAVELAPGNIFTAYRVGMGDGKFRLGFETSDGQVFYKLFAPDTVAYVSDAYEKNGKAYPSVVPDGLARSLGVPERRDGMNRYVVGELVHHLESICGSEGIIEELVSEALENFYERLDQVIGAVKEEYFARQGYQLQDPEEFDRHWAYGGIPYETTKEGNFLVQDKKGRRRYLTVVIYRMGSGRYELTSYISPAGRAGAGKPFERDLRAGMHGEAMEDDDRKECIRCGDKFTDHSRDADADTCPDCLNADAADDAHNKQHDQD